MTVNSFFSALLPYISTVLAICISIGGLWAAICISIGGLWAVHQSHSRQAIELSKQAGEIQERVITAQKTENETLEKRMLECEKKIDHLEAMLETTVKLLEEKGFTLTIGEDTVTLEGEGKVSNIRRKIRPVQKPVQKKETP